MSNAPNYTPTASFANDETNNVAGRSIVSTSKLDTELANASASINALNSNLKKIQRDDDKLQDLIVEPYALSEQTRALLASKGTVRGVWAQNTDYFIGDIVQNSVVPYVCAVNHNSGTVFNVGLWIAISGDGSSLANAQSAALSASNASASASAALTHANNAQTSATNAFNSAISAGSSATNAANSATQAQISATTSSTNASNALISETSALNSASLAELYALEATPHQTAITSGTGLAYLASTALPMAGYVEGRLFTLKMHADCVADATIQFNGQLPVLDIKIRRPDGTFAPVESGDLKAGDFVIGMFIESGTSILVEPSIARSNINYITTNTTLTLENSLDITHVVNATSTLTLPALSTFVEGGSFSVVANATTTINRAGSDVISLSNADVTTMNIGASGHYQFVKSNGKWLAIPINVTLGAGQTWQNVTASRVSGTTYTNTTGRPIMLKIHTFGASAAHTVTVAGSAFPQVSNAGGSQSLMSDYLIPSGATYSVSIVGSFVWWELR